MHECIPVTPLKQLVDGLERYVSGIETDEGLQRLAWHVSKYHDRLPPEVCDLVSVPQRD
jgi:hypothetical protein